MKTLQTLSIALLSSLAINTWAASVQDCHDSRFGIAAIEAGSEKQYANKDITAYSLDSIEPAAFARGVAINVWAYPEEMSYVQCFIVSGLSGLDWNRKSAEYVDGKGLVITVPASEMTSDGDFRNFDLKIAVDRSDRANPKVSILN